MRTVPIRTDLDIVAARVEARSLAKDIGFDIVDQARIATAITELAQNALLYAGAGTVTVRPISPVDEGRPAAPPRAERPADPSPAPGGIEVICQDHGPGIPNLASIMHDDHPLGVAPALATGLSGARRLMDEFHLTSEVGAGTTVTVRKWLPKLRHPLVPLGG